MRRNLSLLLGLVLALSVLAQPEPKMRKKKKNEDKEPPTQALAIPPDPPVTISAEVQRLTFQVSPLSAKGLLSQQSRDALKALMQMNHGASIVRLRAFVAGTGDMRRVQTIVSETFTEKKQPLPVLTTVQVGGLPMVGAQVVLEATSVDRKVTHPNGVVFLAGVRAPDAAGVVAQLKSAGSTSGEVLSVTCFLSALEDETALRTQLTAAFPTAAINIMEAQRSPAGRFFECGATAEASANSRGAVARTGKVVFSGLQMSFGKEDADLRLAFERLKKALGGANVIAAHYYAMDHRVLEKLPEQGRAAFARPDLSSTQVDIEGLPSLDANLGMDVVAEGN